MRAATCSCRRSQDQIEATELPLEPRRFFLPRATGDQKRKTRGGEGNVLFPHTTWAPPPRGEQKEKTGEPEGGTCGKKLLRNNKPRPTPKARHEKAAEREGERERPHRRCLLSTTAPSRHVSSIPVSVCFGTPRRDRVYRGREKGIYSVRVERRNSKMLKRATMLEA